jgi:hypothetical protein
MWEDEIVCSLHGYFEKKKCQQVGPVTHKSLCLICFSRRPISLCHKESEIHIITFMYVACVFTIRDFSNK